MNNVNTYLSAGQSHESFVLKSPLPKFNRTFICPMCHGYGGWNLRVDAYGPGKHFDASCSQCDGYGFVRPNSLDATCIHERVELFQKECQHLGISHYGMFCHVYRCKKCGDTITQDSSG